MSKQYGFHLAIDLGAGSGRAMLGRIEPAGLRLREVDRFYYPPRSRDGHLRWDFAKLIEGVRGGIRSAESAAAAMGGHVESVGVDSWGVDYGLLSDAGQLLEDPVSYRDDRTAGTMEEVFARIPRDEIFGRTGIQFLPINTLYQLVAHVREGLPPGTARLLMIPDLCHHALCGSLVTERTDASTTQLLGVFNGEWEPAIFDRLGLPMAIMPEIVTAGAELGTLSSRDQAELGVGPLRVVAPATHDTGSAVAGTPLTPGWAYISSGTWALVGAELDAPLVNEMVARANFTNEAGACGTIRFLKNVTGLWMLEACRREWLASGLRHDHAAIVDQVSAVHGFAGLVFPDDPRFFNPPSMVRELRASLAETGQAAPEDPVLLTKVILDSLAFRCASVVGTMEVLTGREVPGIHIVGGGSMNAYLNQAMADASGRPVVAGPVEATSAGNLLIQAIACGEIASLAEGRRLLAQSIEPRPFNPRSHAVWAEARKRYQDIEGTRAA